MKRVNQGILFGGLGLFTISFAGTSQTVPVNEKPNLVFILADDLGWKDLQIEVKSCKSP